MSDLSELEQGRWLIGVEDVTLLASSKLIVLGFWLVLGVGLVLVNVRTIEFIRLRSAYVTLNDSYGLHLRLLHFDGERFEEGLVAPIEND